MGQELDFRQKVIEEYRQSVEPLLSYLPWLEQHSGKESYSIYGNEGIQEHSLGFPVYDATLLRFVRQAEKTTLMDKNYRYVYTRNRLDSHDAERDCIQRATIKEWGILKGILSRYCLGGRVKACLWSEAVKEDIFYLVLLRMQEIARQWDPSGEALQ